MPPFCFRPRFAKTRNHSQFVFGILRVRHQFESPHNRVELSRHTYTFSLIEFPSHFSRRTCSTGDRLSQNLGETASATPEICYSALLDAIKLKDRSTPHTQRTHFYHALVIVFRAPPIFGALWIRASFNTLDPKVGMLVFTSTGQKTSQPP